MPVTSSFQAPVEEGARPGASLSPADRLTLRQALVVLQQASSAVGGDSGGARDGADPDESRRRFARAFGYLVGFLDGRGLIASGTAKPGYAQALGGARAASATDGVDQLSTAVQQLLQQPDTRISPVGVVVGAAIYTVGAYLLST